MIFRAYFDPSSWLTLVVRADSEERAREIALQVVRRYSVHDEAVELERIDPDGLEGVIVEDAS